MRQPSTPLIGLHPHTPVVLMGTAWSLNSIPLKALARAQRAGDVVTIGCNRILGRYKPTYYCVADREPYYQEIELIRAFKGVRLLAETIFNPEMPSQSGHHAPDYPRFDWVAWRPTTHAMLGRRQEREAAYRGRIKVVELDPRNPIISGANIAYCMLQWAIIMGAKQIGLIGIDLKWESNEKSHYWGDGRTKGCRPFPSKTAAFHMACRNFLRRKERKLGVVTVRNLSPTPGPLDDIWGKEEFGAWMKRVRRGSEKAIDPLTVLRTSPPPEMRRRPGRKSKPKPAPKAEPKEKRKPRWVRIREKGRRGKTRGK